MSFSVDNSVKISLTQSQKLGRRLQEIKPRVEDFLNPQFFPPNNVNSEDLVRFFFFVTAIDHRTSPPGQSFEGTVEEGYFQGADLLWHLSLKKFQQNPLFFHPRKMAKITTKQISKWYTVFLPKRVTIRNPAERAALLRDSAQRLLAKYEGSVGVLLDTANHRISPDPHGTNVGLIRLLSPFKAYEDPASKKSFLFLKFLLRRGLWSIVDLDQVQIPVDNHLTRIALRTGIITLPPVLARTLRQRTPVIRELDVALRKKIGEAYSLVGKHASRSVLELDDFFWHFGRHCCLRENPICITKCTSKCFVARHLLSISCEGECPLASICLAVNDNQQRALIEPILETWYY